MELVLFFPLAVVFGCRVESEFEKNLICGCCVGIIEAISFQQRRNSQSCQWRMMKQSVSYLTLVHLLYNILSQVCN